MSKVVDTVASSSTATTNSANIQKSSSKVDTTSSQKQPKKVGLIGLIMIVVGSMIGGGIFNLPTDIAQSAGVYGAIIAWAITCVGVFFIAKTFQTLSDVEPQITGGIYYYAKTGFGSYLGYNSAWGYWLSNVIGNVSFVVLVVDALTRFFHGIGGSKSWVGIIIGTVLIWIVVIIVSYGVQSATVINTIATIAKVVPVIIGCFILIINFKYHIFSLSLFAENVTKNTQNLGSIFHQVQGAMLQTMWVFIGIEGAVVISGRAKSARDCGKATLIGYIFTCVVYLLTSILAYGVAPQKELAKMADPSLGGLLSEAAGNWAGVMVDVGVVICVLGAWISWTVLTAEIPFLASKDKMFPKFLGKENKHKAPIGALITNGVIMQVTFILSILAANAFASITNYATALVLIPYGLSAGFMWKVGIKKKMTSGYIYGIGGIIYSIYMMYSAGWQQWLWVIVLYACGFAFWLWLSHVYKRPLFDNSKDKLMFWILSICGILALIALVSINFL